MLDSATRSTEQSAAAQYTDERRSHWDSIARKKDHWSGLGNYYHKRLEEIYRFLIPTGQSVLEVGCGQGDLLAAVQPLLGVGIDFSAEMIQRARKQHPNLHFIQADAQHIPLNAKFDFIILSDLVDDLWDVQSSLQQLAPLLQPNGRLIVNTYSRLWELPLTLARKMKLANSRLTQNWLTVHDLANMLHLADMELIRRSQEILWPLRTPLIDSFFNKFLVKQWGFRQMAMMNVLIARRTPSLQNSNHEPSVSVIVPARNEAGNIAQIFSRTPRMGSATEIIFVEGHSKDNTYAAIQDEIAKNNDTPAFLFRQKGEGKGDAVREGFSHASGEVLMILDADLTVPPEDLSRFYEVLRSGKADFANGVRLIYPMEKQAMRFWNQIGNKFFSLAFSWLLGQPIKDTLCGTKALRAEDYRRIAENRSYFGDFDPFGDFDLLFGAAKLNLKIVEVPVRYRERTYGATNIQRWKHGWLLLRMVMFAAKRMKFV